MKKLLDPDKALELVLGNIPAPVPLELPLREALGRTLVAPVMARCDQPPFTKAMMDGFAVCVADAGAWVDVVDLIAAGHFGTQRVAPGRAAEIMTGAPCPPGTEAVVKVEDCERDGDRVRLPAPLLPEQHLQAQGGFCRAGDVILPVGAPFTAVSMAVVASMGQPTVQVAAPPSLAIITTGDELGTPGEELGDAQIYDSNGPMLLAQAHLAGAGETSRLHARDDPDSLAAAFEQTKDVAILVLTGGVSMGKYDLVPNAVVAAGGEKIFHKVAHKPGKPILFARRGDQLIFGLPGTPLGCHFGFHRFVSTAIRVLTGHDPLREQRTGRLVAPVVTQGRRTHFRLVRAFRDGDGWGVDPLEWRGSSDLVGPGLANSYLRFEPGETRLEAGDSVTFERVDGAD